MPNLNDLLEKFLSETYGGTAHDIRVSVLREFVDWTAREKPKQQLPEGATVYCKHCQGIVTRRAVPAGTKLLIHVDVSGQHLPSDHVPETFFDDTDFPDAAKVAEEYLDTISIDWRIEPDDEEKELLKIIVGHGGWNQFDHHLTPNAEFAVACAQFLVRDLVDEIKNLRNYQSTINLNIPDPYRQRTLDVSMARMRDALSRSLDNDGKNQVELSLLHLRETLNKIAEPPSPDTAIQRLGAVDQQKLLRDHGLKLIDAIRRKVMGVDYTCEHGFAMDMACDDCGRSGFRVPGWNAPEE